LAHPDLGRDSLLGFPLLDHAPHMSDQFGRSFAFGFPDPYIHADAP
jgi:hypothetical protein